MNIYKSSEGPRYAPCASHNFVASATISQASCCVPDQPGVVSCAMRFVSPNFRTAIECCLSSSRTVEFAHDQNQVFLRWLKLPMNCTAQTAFLPSGYEKVSLPVAWSTSQ